MVGFIAIVVNTSLLCMCAVSISAMIYQCLCFGVTLRLALMEEELVRERIRKVKELAQEEAKMRREFEREQRMVHKITQECQVQ